MSEPQDIDWKTHGVKVIPKDSLDPNTPQTPGMNRAAAINFARVGAQKIWAGTVSIHPNDRTIIRTGSRSNVSCISGQAGCAKCGEGR